MHTTLVGLGSGNIIHLIIHLDTLKKKTCIIYTIACNILFKLLDLSQKPLEC